MPIEFRCSQCGQLLRVPESAAGKNARCPKCQALMTVPGLATALLSSAEPPSAPQQAIDPVATAATSESSPAPLANPFASDSGTSYSPPPPNPSAGSPFAPATDSSASQNPYASPAPTAYAYATQYIGQRPGLPWEYEPKSFGSWFRTMGMVISSPTNAFSRMRQYGGLGPPLMFNLFAVGMLVALALVIVAPIGLYFAFAQARNNNQGEVLAGAAVIGGFGLLFAIFYAFMIAVVGPFIWSAIAHLMLMLYGAARQGFETTFRVICFAYFSILVPGIFLAIIPYLGGFAMSIWVMVVVILGLSRAHEITGGKAALAVLTPVGVCCGLYIVLIASFLGLGFAGAFR